MSLKDELAFMDATDQAALVRNKQVTPAELVAAAIERIESVNPAVNAVITTMYPEARRRADAPNDGPFAGVPYLLKDLIAFEEGIPLSGGSRFVERFIAPIDSEIVVRHKRAGLLCLGKTNTPEFGILPTTEPALFGPTRNPWDTTRTAGGSSGGAAAAVASGMVPIAHGNDGGGSIRIPASCCGLFGLKPTRARNPVGPMLGDVMSGLVAEHALTRSVRDSAALLDATAGPEPGDPYWAPPQARPFLDEVGADPGRLRIAFSTVTLGGAPLHADVVAAVRDTAKLCEELGHDVVEAALPIGHEPFTTSFLAAWAGGIAWTLDSFAQLIGREASAEWFEPSTWMLYEMGRRTSASEYLLAVQSLQEMSRRIAPFFAEYDVWLTPTLAEPPPVLGSFDPTDENPAAAMTRTVEFVPFTPIFNATGQPAMSVPLSWNSEGLPIGSHFAGRFGDEATLFRLAAQLEAARPWKHRLPPTSAITS